MKQLTCEFCHNKVYAEELKDTIIDNAGIFHRPCYNTWVESRKPQTRSEGGDRSSKSAFMGGARG